MKKIETKTGLKSYLESFINETIKSTLQKRALEEEDKQSASASEENDPETHKALKSGDISIEMIVDKLNFIRSGKSFKDERVKLGLDKYLKSLEKPEKVALLSFLKGIAQVVTTEVPPDEALEPEDPPSSVTMEKGSGGKKVTIKPVVIKAGGAASQEDTSGPAPIQPKK